MGYASVTNMDLIFEHGNQDKPKGHAILYYRVGSETVATYVVILPFTVDFAKYIPPVLASQVKSTGMEEFSAFAIPPVPEEVKNHAFLEELAMFRDDDLIFGGEINGNDFLEAAQKVNYVVQAYAQLYQQGTEAALNAGSTGSNPSNLNVDEVIFSLMSERDKLGELAKLLGKLRFAVEGDDARLIKEAESEISAIARYLPDNYKVSRIIEGAKHSVEQGPLLAQLYMDRCYKLADGDYLGLQQVEHSIQEIGETDK
jgi:hypothetical protein